MGRITTNFLNAQLKDLDADGGKKNRKPARLRAFCKHLFLKV
jgi:hypothetical protein